MKIKDIITIGAYGALYLIFVGLGTLVSMLIATTGNMLFAPAFIGLLAGSVYLLLVNKVQRFGAISLLGVMMASFFFLSGHFVVSFIPSLVFGLLADVVAYFGRYKQKAMVLASYIVFSFGNLGPIILMWVMKDAYIARLFEKGKDAAYVQRVMVAFTSDNVLLLFGSVLIGALLGGLFGQYLLTKHFKKAGFIQ